MPSTSVISALEVAIAASPTDVSLRNHLAALLFDSGQPNAALEHYAASLAQDPVNVVALKGASLSAAAAGEPTRAAAYKKLHDSLTSTSASPATTAGFPSGAPTPAPAPPQQTPKLRVIRGGADAEEKDVETDSPDDSLPQVPNLKLADVGGLIEVKRRLEMAFLGPLRNPELRKMYAKKLKGGLLMFGPPGCGKTYIARALAGELQARFLSIGLSDVLDMYMGESERKLHEIFELARRAAPTVLFFDEIDALGQKRAHQKTSSARNVVNQLLNEMDGVDHDNEGVFILGATNHPWDIDSALRRPGRFDRAVLVLPPDEPARVAILASHIKDRPTRDIDVAALAKHSNMFSGADLAFLCESATEHAMEQAVSSGTVSPITMTDFKRAAKDVKPSTRPWFDLAKNYAMYANEGGIYDDLLAYIKANKL